MDRKCDNAIDAAINTIKNKRTELLEKIKSNPRQSAIQRIYLELELKISNPPPIPPRNLILSPNPCPKTGNNTNFPNFGKVKIEAVNIQRTFSTK